jgi:tetratricopeptide (TPR) repeat protein
MRNRKRLRGWFVGGALFLLAGAWPARLSAQSGSTARKRVAAADPAAAELNRLLVAAQDAVDQKDYPTAAKDYQDYLAKKPEDAQVHFNLAFAYTAMKRVGDARMEYEKAISLDPKMGAAYLNLGITLLGIDPKAAVEPLQKAVELSPEDPHAKYFLGMALERDGKAAAAIDEYETAAKSDGSNVELQNALGHALLAAGRSADAEATYRRSLSLNPQGADQARAHAGLAEALVAQKKMGEAVAELDTYLQAQPNDAGARRQRAFALADLGQNDEALRELDRAAGGGEESLPTLKLRAQLYLGKKRYDEAIAVLRKAEMLAPREADLSAALGHVYFEKKDYADAAPELVKAYNLDASNSAVMADIVAAEYELKNYSGTLQALDELAKHKDLPATAWFIRATSYDKLGSLQQALDAYNRFLQMNTDENSDMYFSATARVRALPREIREKGKGK